MKDYLKLLRVKHYIKNTLIFAALLFSGQLLVTDKLVDCSIGLVVFSLVSSSIYIVNDIKDKEKDHLHPLKNSRPIASGKISVKKASVIAVCCLVLAGLLFILIFNVLSLILLITYILINILYSFGLKNIPLIDVTILVCGFLIRVIFGAVITNIEISNWLYLTVIALSFFMSFGKRRNELKKLGSNNTREVLKGYTIGFLDKSMYMCLTMANTFYSLWALSSTDNSKTNLKIITVPLVLLITLKYCLDIEKETSDGDPTEVLFHDKLLIVMGVIYAVVMILILYCDRLISAVSL